MFADNQRISIRQIQALILVNLLGTTVLFLPAQMAEQAGYAAWLVVLLWGLLFAFLTKGLTVLGKRRPSFTVVEWCRFAFGKVLGSVVAVAIGVKIIFDIAMELRIYIEVLCRTMFFEAQLWMPMLALLVVCVLAAIQGIEARGRSAEICVFIVVIPLIVYLILIAMPMDFWRVLPIRMPTISQVQKSLPTMLLPFQGLTFLFFVFPHMKQPKHGIKGVFTASAMMVLIYTAMVFLCLAAYGDEILKIKVYPTLQLLGRVSFSGIFLSRQDVMLLWFWTVSSFTFVSMMLYCVTNLCTRTCGQIGEKKRKYWVLACGVFVFMLALFPEDLSTAYRWREKFSPWTNAILLFVLPWFFLLMDSVKGRWAK